MDTILRLINHLTNPDVLAEYDQYLLLIILVFSFLEVVIPPIPGDTVLVVGSSIAGIAGINPVWIIISSFAGTFTASLFLYNLGNKFERKLLVSAKYSWLLDTKTFLEIEKWFKKYGYWTLLGSRLLPIARSGVILTAGIVNFDRNPALIALSISILLSSTLFVLSGRFLGSRWKEAYLEWGPKFQLILLLSLGLFALLAIGIWVWKKLKNPSQRD
jgi:membrane protein DedA with SNARE-associated domain